MACEQESTIKPIPVLFAVNGTRKMGDHGKFY